MDRYRVIGLHCNHKQIWGKGGEGAYRMVLCSMHKSGDGSGVLCSDLFHTSLCLSNCPNEIVCGVHSLYDPARPCMTLLSYASTSYNKITVMYHYCDERQKVKFMDVLQLH